MTADDAFKAALSHKILLAGVGGRGGMPHARQPDGAAAAPRLGLAEGGSAGAARPHADEGGAQGKRGLFGRRRAQPPAAETTTEGEARLEGKMPRLVVAELKQRHACA